MKGVYTSLPRNYARFSTQKKYLVVRESILAKHGIDIGNLDLDMVRTALDSFEAGTIEACLVSVHILTQDQPLGVRGVMYAGIGKIFLDNKKPSYRKCCQLILDMRRKGVVPYPWITDGTRRSLKPSSWSGLASFADSVNKAYRRDLWSRQPDYVHVFVEKDGMAGIIEPVTEEYDVNLTPLRGFGSETILWEVAQEWKQIEKPIWAYYLGDRDPDAGRIENDAQKRLEGFCGFKVTWIRLAVTDADFCNPNFLGFQVSRKDKRSKWQPYLDRYGDRCVEVNAIPAPEIRARVRTAIESHIDQNEWAFLKDQEEREKHDVFESCALMKERAS